MIVAVVGPFILLAARSVLAAVFLLSGATKLVDPRGTRRALREFGVPSGMAGAGVLALPLLEIATALLLIPNDLSWYGGGAASGLLGVFLVAIATAMMRGRQPDCHCFGQLHSAPIGWKTVARNLGLAALAGIVVRWGRGYNGPQVWDWIVSLTGFEFKVAMAAVCLAVISFFMVVGRARPRKVKAVAVEEVEEEVEVEVEDEAVVEKPPIRRPRPAAKPEPEPVTAPGPLDIGLPVGTTAPAFELPGLNGEKRSLDSLKAQGKDLVLIFSSPHCKPCAALAANMVRWKYEITGLPNIYVISRGTPGENLKKLSGFEARQILLQEGSEVAALYDCSATPTGVWVGVDGRIKSELVSGPLAIRELLARCAGQASAGQQKSKSAQRASVFEN